LVVARFRPKAGGLALPLGKVFSKGAVERAAPFFI